MNKRFFADNLEILRNKITDASVDLVYLDLPFNSDAQYTVFFDPEKAMSAQVEASLDTWTWDEETEWCFIEAARTGGVCKRSPQCFRAG
jgi:16S rRNA G966 N2-methylase RsmD